MLLRAAPFVCTLLLLSISAPVQAQQPESQAKNVILLIGDGMGLTQMSSIYFRDVDKVHFDEMTHIGLIKTWSSNAKITDSASSATAYAAGVKTYNGAIGVNADTVSVPSIIEQISPNGIATGLLATSSITHATPAAFYAHAFSRNMHYGIAEQLVTSDVDFFAGGGLQYFADRRDGKNLFGKLEERGFEVDSTALLHTDALDAAKKYGFLLEADGMMPILEGRGDFLPEATSLALAYFQKKDMPFFMMIEGSQIDWGGHANASEYVMTEVEDFNKTLGRVLDFAKADGNTLVVVTADHETGGFALSAGDDYNALNGTFSTGGHTATLVPVYAFGPGARVFNGIYQNTAIYNKILEATGW